MLQIKLQGVEPGTRIIRCKKCQQWKPIDDFYKNRMYRTGYQTTCKPCHHMMAREWKKANPEISKKQERKYKLKRHYKLTPLEWDKLFEAQGKVCALCKASDPGTKSGWHTDHDHKTGRVRGILCFICNRHIGIFEHYLGREDVQSYLMSTPLMKKPPSEPLV